MSWSSFFSKKKWFQNKKKNNHVGNHKVIFNINKNRFIKTVNSFHHETIEFKKKNNVNIFGLCEDGTVESFHIKNKKNFRYNVAPRKVQKN